MAKSRKNAKKNKGAEVAPFPEDALDATGENAIAEPAESSDNDAPAHEVDAAAEIPGEDAPLQQPEDGGGDALTNADDGDSTFTPEAEPEAESGEPGADADDAEDDAPADMPVRNNNEEPMPYYIRMRGLGFSNTQIANHADRDADDEVKGICITMGLPMAGAFPLFPFLEAVTSGQAISMKEEDCQRLRAMAAEQLERLIKRTEQTANEIGILKWVLFGEGRMIRPARMRSAVTTAYTASRTAANPGGKRLGLKAAAAVALAITGKTMRCGELLDAILTLGLWEPGDGKTPEASLSAGILTDIKTLGSQSRFVKVSPGHFRAADWYREEYLRENPETDDAPANAPRANPDAGEADYGANGPEAPAPEDDNE